MVLLTSSALLPLSGAYKKRGLTLTTQNLTAVLNEARLRSMSGEMLSQPTTLRYGISFQTDRFIFFAGDTYDSANTSNIENKLDNNLTFSEIGFPGNEVVFDKVTGEVWNFNADSNYVVLTEGTTNQSKTILINKYGAIDVQ